MNDPSANSGTGRPRRIPFWIRRILRDSSTYPQMRLARRAARRAGRRDWEYVFAWLMGYEESRNEARIIVARRSVLSLLQKRFGSVPPEVEAWVRATTDAAKLDAALLRVFDIAAPDELLL
jgi:hypothetical protein